MVHVDQLLHGLMCMQSEQVHSEVRIPQQTLTNIVLDHYARMHKFSVAYTLFYSRPWLMHALFEAKKKMILFSFILFDSIISSVI